MISTITDKLRRRIEKAGAVFFALLLWQIGAMLLDENLLLVTPLTVVQRLFTLCTEADFLSTIGFSFMRIAFGFLLGLFIGSILAVIAGRFYLAEVMLYHLW